DLAAITEGLVDMPVTHVAHHREHNRCVVFQAEGMAAADEDLAVALYANCGGAVVVQLLERGSNLPAGSEAWIHVAVGVVADGGPLFINRIINRTDREDLAVGLNGERAEPASPVQDGPVLAEPRVQVPIRQVPHEGAHITLLYV